MAALLVGCGVGAVVMAAINVMHLGQWPTDLRQYFHPVNVFNGAFAAALAFGLALAVVRGEISPRRAVHRHPLAWSLVAGAVVGLLVMAGVNIPLYNSGQWPDHGREILGLWGELAGLGAAAATFFFARSRIRRAVSYSDRPEIEPRRKIGVLMAAFVAGLFGLVITSYNVAWGLSLFSLEGAWLWPLAIGPLVLSVVLFRSYLR